MLCPSNGVSHRMLVNQKQLSEIIGKSTRHIRRMADNGMPVHHSEGRENIYNTIEIFKWVQTQAASKQMTRLRKQDTKANSITANWSERIPFLYRVWLRTWSLNFLADSGGKAWKVNLDFCLTVYRRLLMLLAEKMPWSWQGVQMAAFMFPSPGTLPHHTGCLKSLVLMLLLLCRKSSRALFWNRPLVGLSTPTGETNLSGGFMVKGCPDRR